MLEDDQRIHYWRWQIHRLWNGQSIFCIWMNGWIFLVNGPCSEWSMQWVVGILKFFCIGPAQKFLKRKEKKRHFIFILTLLDNRFTVLFQYPSPTSWLFFFYHISTIEGYLMPNSGFNKYIYIILEWIVWW